MEIAPEVEPVMPRNVAQAFSTRLSIEGSSSLKTLALQSVQPGLRVYCRLNRIVTTFQTTFELYIENSDGTEQLILTAQKHIGKDAKYSIFSHEGHLVGKVK